MKLFTAYTRDHAPPVLVRDGFSLGALIFGPLWLLAHRAWIAGVLTLCAWIGFALLHDPWRAVLLVALHWIIGLTGRDMQCWSLERRGYLLAHVVAGSTEDAALSRLLARRPDLIADAVE